MDFRVVPVQWFVSILCKKVLLTCCDGPLRLVVALGVSQRVLSLMEGHCRVSVLGVCVGQLLGVTGIKILSFVI